MDDDDDDDDEVDDDEELDDFGDFDPDGLGTPFPPAELLSSDSDESYYFSSDSQSD